MKISIIIPVRNEQSALQINLPQLQWARQLGHEIIVVDGESHDDTRITASQFADKVISSPPGRAHQMNAGAAQASGEIFLFLHIDTVFTAIALQSLCDAITGNSDTWGRFDIRLSGGHAMFRVIERMINIRSRLSGIATGDQAIFISKTLFCKSSGFPEIPLMEDVALSTSLRRLHKPICLKQCIVTSSRRWEENGILNTVLLMWKLRLAYWLGADPHILAKQYHQ